MVQDPRKQQKKLERRKAKEKAQRRELVRRESGGMPARLSAAASAPVLHCVRLERLWLSGIGHVLISRQLRGGEVAFACFLVDVWCLGVKDVIINVAPRPRYETNMYQKLAQQGMVSLRPEVRPQAGRGRRRSTRWTWGCRHIPIIAWAS